jgi:hypothetical protein
VGSPLCLTKIENFPARLIRHYGDAHTSKRSGVLSQDLDACWEEERIHLGESAVEEATSTLTNSASAKQPFLSFPVRPPLNPAGAVIIAAPAPSKESPMDNIIIAAAAVGMFTKVLVDAVKTTPLYTKGWLLVLLAFLFGQACSFLLAMATGHGLSLTQKAVSTCVLVGFLAAGSAIGVTELHKTAEGKKEGY